MMFVLGTIFGILITVLGYILSGKIKLYNLKSEYKSVFTEVHQSIGTKSMRFLNRVNQIVTFKVRTRSFGSFDMVIYLDKNQISLFRNQRLIYKSEVENNIVLVKSELINSIIGDIDVEYPQMHDLVAVSGAMIDKKTFDDMLKNAKMEFKSQSSIDDLMGTTSKKQDEDLDLDSILDKINKVGLNGLTEKELKYLKDQSK
jgi:predicted DNA binding protein